MISVIIPVYKNTSELIKNLLHNIPFLKECEIIVVNDDPERSIKDVVGRFDVALIENKNNLGFAGAIDKGIIRSKNRYVMLLNSDVLLNDKSFLKGLSVMRQEENIFAISFNQQEKDKSKVGKNVIYWENGFFQHKKAPDLTPGINGWAEGGACLIDKRKYEEIGGFDPLYSPFYWEDIDLSYRAWKKGYIIRFDPEILVEHHHESTIKKYYSMPYIKTVSYRNQFIFIWKNINDAGLLLSHIANIIRMLPVMIFKDRALISGLWKAFCLLPEIRKKRTTYIINDKVILNKFI